LRKRLRTVEHYAVDFQQRDAAMEGDLHCSGRDHLFPAGIDHPDAVVVLTFTQFL
jgi:hypothetical protein